MRTNVRTLATGVAAQLELMVQFKKIAADKRVEGKGKKKREVVSVNGGGKTCVDMASMAATVRVIPVSYVAHAPEAQSRHTGAACPERQLSGSSGHIPLRIIPA